MLLGKSKLNTIEVLTSKALINSYISHGRFVSVSKFLSEYYQIKKIKDSETSLEYITLKYLKRIESVVKNILLTKIQVSGKLIKID